MTAAPIAATCTAQITTHVHTYACTGHLGIYHVADMGDGGLRLWLDGDDHGTAPWEAPMIARIRAVTGGDMPTDDAARVEAIGSAAITLHRHQWMGVHPQDLAEHGCACGWVGDDHERHVAEQLWTLGALDRHAAPVRRVVQAATAMARRIGPGRRNLTRETAELIASVDALGGGS